MSKYIKISDEERANIKKSAGEQIKSVQDKLAKWADKIVVGYTPPIQSHKEGEIWIENDKEWTIKNGIKQTIGKLDYSKARVPFWCPRCGTPLTHKLHEKFYLLRGACHNCVVGWEGKMRLDGVWNAYELRTMRNNEKSWLHDQIAKNEDYERTFKNPQIHFENGGWQELATKTQFQSKFDEMHKDIMFMKGRLAQIEKEESADEENYKILDKWLVQHPWENWNVKS